ncbi:MAG: SDR family NAD(P)-dependent oxidoreductase [Hyphomicrobiaceae bacterium]|nr:SDR family NAD(P)-dependent oxidoreductase [Hyphomicrobiaceae bacterium]
MTHIVEKPATAGVVWITGASSGIGRALALAYARRGVGVAATARSVEGLDALAREAGGLVRAYPADVTDAAAIAATVDRIEAEMGPIATAILNAGIYLPVRAQNLGVEDCARSFRVNLDGTVHCLVPLLARMGARRAGQIAIVSSSAGYRGLPTSAAYGATKAGLINLAESLKFDTDNMGIDLRIVTPGFVETAATDRNPFPMPAIVSAETAAARIIAGLAGRRFDITFPRRFTLVLKALALLPASVYFAIVARATGWRGKRD